MAVRLLEMRRALKDTGSIYLHCDPDGRSLVEVAHGQHLRDENFRKDLVRKRRQGHSSAKHYAAVRSMTRFGSIPNLTGTFGPMLARRAATVTSRDASSLTTTTGRGRHWADDLTGSGTRNGATGEEWRGFDPTERGRRRMYSPEVPDQTDANCRIYRRKSRTAWPKLKRCLGEAKGRPRQGTFGDIYALETMGGNRRERLGYPTQKPLALLERIIRASCNEGGVVLDPFCGCATACAAAENPGRRWIGIDSSPKAVEPVRNQLVAARTDIPVRTDIDAPAPCRQNKHVGFGQRDGRCDGC